MTKLEQIETAIAALAERDLAAFRRWFAKFDAARWDKQIERDSQSGKLDKLLNRAKAEHRKGKSRPL
jgi:predicted sugar kinase